MPPLHNFTTKGKEAIRKAHELAIERGENHVNPLHLLTALILQEESMVTSILDKLEVDTIMLTDALIELIESSDAGQTAVSSSTYQIYLTPELATIIENSARVTADLGDDYVSTEHLFLATIEEPGNARDVLERFKIDRDGVLQVLEHLRSSPEADEGEVPKTNKTLERYTRNLTKEASENKLDPVIGRDPITTLVFWIHRRVRQPTPIGLVTIRCNVVCLDSQVDVSVDYFPLF